MRILMIIEPIRIVGRFVDCLIFPNSQKFEFSLFIFLDCQNFKVSSLKVRHQNVQFLLLSSFSCLHTSQIKKKRFKKIAHTDTVNISNSKFYLNRNLLTNSSIIVSNHGIKTRGNPLGTVFD